MQNHSGKITHKLYLALQKILDSKPRFVSAIKTLRKKMIFMYPFLNLILA